MSSEENNPPEATEEGADSPTPEAMVVEEDSTSTTVVVASTKKRPRSPLDTPPAPPEKVAAVSAASAAGAAQLCATMGWQGLYSLLSASAVAGSSSSSSSSQLPTVAQVQQAAQRLCTDSPPYCHLSKSDAAPQLKIGDPERRMLLKGGMRGYRMARASQGATTKKDLAGASSSGSSSGDSSLYWEAWILPSPRVSEIVDGLPHNIRMSPKLQAQMDQALAQERNETTTMTKTSTFGAHVRLGWSLRSGDLQAPVGYDKWSYGIRDLGGSKLHESRREDDWGSEGFGPGDVIGCALTSYASSDNDEEEEEEDEEPPMLPQIRFFKNGQLLGKTADNPSGVAFECDPGVYFPAISLYMGASVQFNPGPHFVYPPKKMTGIPRFQPLSELVPEPMGVEQALERVQKEKVFRKADMLHTFQELVETEVNVLQSSFQSHRIVHVQEVYRERQKRELKVDDLEQDTYYELAKDGIEKAQASSATDMEVVEENKGE